MEQRIRRIDIYFAAGIKECFANGLSPNVYYNNEPLFYELTSEYLRSPAFKDCVKTFVEHGLIFDNKALLSVLSDDAQSLELELKNSPGKVNERYTLRCAFTPLYKVSLLHICAEFNHVSCARVLAKYGADINSKAGVDEHGFGGQAPIFHTVNQILNQSLEMLHFLLSNGADLKISITGLIWGKNYEWETFIPCVNPISYAMMGLLPQMHRNEKDIAETVSLLLSAAYGINYTASNIPNKYLSC